MSTDADGPSDEATLERAASLANDAVRAVALQCRRLRASEPEDNSFIFRHWTDLQFLVVSLYRLRRVALLAADSERHGVHVQEAIGRFDESVPDLTRARNVAEHIDDYALDKGHDSEIGRRQLQVGSWDGTTWRWLGGELDIDGRPRGRREPLRSGPGICRAF